MRVDRYSRLRATIAIEAARLMYEEGVKQYFTAKRMASRRVCGKVGGKRLRYRPRDLPSNGEIRDALLGLAELAEGSRRTRRLFAMRIVALEAMRSLLPFDPRLIGSVSTGHIRRGSDIDLHVFTDDPDALARHLRDIRWAFEQEKVSIQKFGQIREYLHIHVADVFAVELTVYERREMRFRPRSSTDGKPIVRLRLADLEAILARDHAEAWGRFLADGTVEGLDEAHEESEDDPLPGPFDGLLEAPSEDDLAWLPPPNDEALDEDGDYDPLPGFEDLSGDEAGPSSANPGAEEDLADGDDEEDLADEDDEDDLADEDDEGDDDEADDDEAEVACVRRGGPRSRPGGGRD
jgi:hypothetical protein